MSARSKTARPLREVERIQTGVRLEKRLLKVLKGLAECLDLSLGDLLEGIALHALENKPPFKCDAGEDRQSAADLRTGADGGGQPPAARALSAVSTR